MSLLISLIAIIKEGGVTDPLFSAQSSETVTQETKQSTRDLNHRHLLLGER